jgi:hypothetical protein
VVSGTRPRWGFEGAEIGNWKLEIGGLGELAEI